VSTQTTTKRVNETEQKAPPPGVSKQAAPFVPLTIAVSEPSEGKFKQEQQEDEENRFRPISSELTMRLLRRLKPHWRLYTFGSVCGVMCLLLELSTPRITQQIIDKGIPSGSTELIFMLAGLWLGLRLMAQVLDAAQIWATSRCGERVILDLRIAVFDHLQKLGMSFYDKTKLGRIITRGTSDLDSLRATVISGINTVALNAIMMVGATVMLLVADWRVFLAVFWLAPVMFFTNQIYRKKIAVSWQRVRAGWSRVASNLAENITGVRVVSAFNRQDRNLDRFNELQEDNTANNLNAAHVNGIYQPLLDYIGFIGQVIILGYGGALILSDASLPADASKMTVGKLIAIFSYWGFYMQPTKTMGDFYNTLMQAMASAERVFALLDLKPDIEDAPDAKPLPKLKGHIIFDHVTFGYDPARPVLHDVCLEIPAGKTFALVGATGSGKSSTVSLLARFYEFQKGRITVDGIDIRSATLESLHKQMGLVLQVNYLFSGSIMNNIRYPRPEATEEEVYAAAKALGIHETFMSLPQGYETDVGERGAGVSMGIRQLICFTRVLVANVSIFLLDEATSSIDTVTEMKVQAALEKLVAGRTTVIVAHRLSTIVKSDCIVVLQHGKIIEYGRHDELLEKKGHYAALYEQFISDQAEKPQPQVGEAS
jgi:ATP-binding cassette subfamily B protein